MSWESEVEQIKQRREAALKQGGEDSIGRQHAKGRLTIRERIDALIDPGSFDEIGKAAGGAEYGANGELIDFTPANFVLGFATLRRAADFGWW